jgi:hypothetical protein
MISHSSRLLAYNFIFNLDLLFFQPVYFAKPQKNFF